MARHRADPDLAVVLGDVAELVRERVDVDQVGGRGQAELHHREQRVPAGEQARVGSQLRQQLERLLDARRSLILKWGWNLQCAPSRT